VTLFASTSTTIHNLAFTKHIALSLLITFSGWGVHAQTVGLFENGPESFDGYTLVSANGATRTHLIDNCGRVINQWDSDYRAGESAYLLDDGSLLRTARINSQTFNGGGIGGRIERFNWEGDLIWSYELATDTTHHHHDMAWLPNGNVVLMAWEYKSPEEAAAAGRIADGPLWPPMLVEIEPNGPESVTAMSRAVDFQGATQVVIGFIAMVWTMTPHAII